MLAAEAPPVPVGVGLREWAVTVYRRVVPAGPVQLNLRNFGEDAHNVQVLGPRGYRSALSPDVRAGRDGVLLVRLRRAGRYRLVCVKPGHPALGMRATLRVRRPRR